MDADFNRRYDELMGKSVGVLDNGFESSEAGTVSSDQLRAVALAAGRTGAYIDIWRHVDPGGGGPLSRESQAPFGPVNGTPFWSTVTCFI